MKKCFVLLAAVAVIASSLSAALPVKVLGPGRGAANFRVPYHQTSDLTLYKDTLYVLTGWYFVDSLYKITIQPGTLILGDSTGSGGTLIISRGAKIIADGTRNWPIVFASEKSPATRAVGDWGGLIVLGKGITNKPATQQIEGGFGTIPNTNAMYGGSVEDDSSGVIRYVRIEFGGIAYAQDNEINGLTLGGVGSKTLIDYVQVSFGGDDDFEFFGGSVNAKHLVSWRNTDDNMDSDFGYAGYLQYVFVKRDSLLFDASASGSSNGFESDNEGSAPYSATPRTKLKISNATFIGPAYDTNSTINAKWDNTAMIRRASELSIYNSSLMGWHKGLNLRDTLTQRAAIDSILQIRNTSIQAKGSVLQLSSSPNTGNISGFNLTSWFNTAGWGNLGSAPRNTSDIGLVNHFPLNATIDPRPKTTSELATAGTGYRKWGLPTWFDSVAYRGAFNPALPMDQQWTADWTNFTPEKTDYSNGQPANFIVVDGMKDAFYGTLTGPLDGYIQMRSSAYNNNGAPKSDADLSAKVWTAWDSTWFYFYEEVMDDTISGNGVNSYQDDGLELKFDAQAKDSVANTIFGVNLTALGGTGSDSLNNIADIAKMWARKTITGGYALELAIKWSAIGTTEKVSVAVDSVFGLAVNTHDNDGNLSIGGGRQASVQWAAVMDDAVWNTPKYLGTVMFLSGNKLLFDDKNNMTGRSNPYKYDGTDIPLSVKITGQGIPTEYRIGQNYPNPFNPSTTIRYELPVTGLVTLKVYNIVGQEVSTLVNAMQEAGRYEARFDAAKLSSGVYFYTIRAGNYLQTKKMLLLK